MDREFDVLEQIKSLCAERGCSCYELSKRSGIPYSTLNTMLLKGNQPSIPTLRRICSGFGITMQQFFGCEGGDKLSEGQKECLSLFSVLNAEEQALAIAYLKGLAHRL